MDSSPLGLWRRHLAGDDVLLSYRPLIATVLSVATVLMLGPLAVWHGLNGRWALAGFILVAVLTLLVELPALRQGREPPVPLVWVIGMLTFAIGGAIWQTGVNALLWAYPTLFVSYFVLNRRAALWMSGILCILSTVVSALTISPALAGRVAATMLLTLLMINMVLYLLDDLQASLRRQAITDPLTGAFNRRYFDALLRELLAGRRANRPGNALLAIDIDHFKSINDRYGHAVGDQVLCGLVALLRHRLRRDDTLFRTGGEEFMLLLPGVAEADALRMADELRREVAQAPLLAAGPVTISIGVSMQTAKVDADAWVRAGDDALYQAKRSGRNRVVLAEASASGLPG